MKIDATEFGPSYDWANAGSAVASVQFDRNQLVIGIEGPEEIDFSVEIRFKYARAHLVVDEGDLIAFWEEGYSCLDSLVLRVASGGLTERVSGGIFSVSQGMYPDGEWLIMSSDTCVYVLSVEAPQILEVRKK